MLCVILNSYTIDCDKMQCFESYKIISIGITLLCCTITTIVREKLSKKKDGTNDFRIVYPKYKKGEFTLKTKKEATGYSK